MMRSRSSWLALAVLAFVGVVATLLKPDITKILQAETILACVLAWSFVLLYAVRSPWRSTTVGRSLMYVWVSLAVILSLIATSYWFGYYPGRTAVRLVIYSSMPIVFAKFLWVLIQVQNGRLRGEIPRRVDADL